MNPIIFSVAGDNIGQVITMIVCVCVCMKWLKLWRANWRVRPLALYPIIISVLTLIFYSIVLFTDLNEANRVLFTFISSMLRLFIMLLLLLAGFSMDNHR
jgi:hypothetical protein